jgi:hypothetical protein
VADWRRPRDQASEHTVHFEIIKKIQDPKQADNFYWQTWRCSCRVCAWRLNRQWCFLRWCYRKIIDKHFPCDATVSSRGEWGLVARKCLFPVRTGTEDISELAQCCDEPVTLLPWSLTSGVLLFLPSEGRASRMYVLVELSALLWTPLLSVLEAF